MPTVRVSTKGQIVIPVEIREKLGITPGTWLQLSSEGSEIHIRVLGDDLVEATRGFLKGEGRPLTELLLEERARDREREDTKFDHFFPKKRAAAGK